jgi:hypothetical protein
MSLSLAENSIFTSVRENDITHFAFLPMQGSTGQLSLIFPASGADGTSVCSALAWPGQNALLRSPTGITVEVTVTPVTKEEEVPPPAPVPAKVLECLRYSIQIRVEDLAHAAIQNEMRATADTPSVRWLRLVAQGFNKDKVMTLTINVQHHLAYQALAVALLHPPRNGFKVHKEPLWYAISLVDTAPLMQLLTAPRAKGAAAAMKPPSETQLITRSFVETAFRGAATKGAIFAPHFPKLSKTRWHVALEDRDRNPLAAPAPPSVMWSEGTRVYDPADGRFVLTLVVGKGNNNNNNRGQAPLSAETRGDVKKEAKQEEEERWIMIDDFGTVARR